MSDIDTVWDVQNGRGDWLVDGADLRSGHDLATALLISTFTDAEAPADAVIPDGSTDRRGWCGDEGSTYKIGSLLWLLSRSKLTQQVAIQAVEYEAQALQWMIDDGIVGSFVISSRIVKPSQLWLIVQAFRAGAKNAAWTWEVPVIYPNGGDPTLKGILVTENGDWLVTEDGSVLTI